MDFKENQNTGTMEIIEKHRFDKDALTSFMEENIDEFKVRIDRPI